MDKDRIAGSAQQIKGKIEQAAGKVVGDAKLEADGVGDQIEGRARNVVGSAKDAVRDQIKK